MQNVESSAHLSIPLRLALGQAPEVPDLSISGHIDIPAGDLQVLPLLVKPEDSTVPLFDTTALHTLAAVDMALS
jgi:hypothetical protein